MMIYINHIKSLSDQQVLQDTITALFAWSLDSDLNFNIKKFIHLSFQRKFETTYSMSDSIIPHVGSHKDLGVILSEDLSWEKHHNVHHDQVVCIFSKITNTLLYSDLATTFDERYC